MDYPRYILYSDLPPGRQRRLLYDKQFKQIDNIKRLLRRMTYTTEYHTHNTPEIITEDSFVIEDYSNLEPVSVSLSVKKLCENSDLNINTEENKLCIICQENIDLFDMRNVKKTCIVRILKCNHVFHIHCIDKWLSFNKKCPLCKTDLDI